MVGARSADQGMVPGRPLIARTSPGPHAARIAASCCRRCGSGHFDDVDIADDSQGGQQRRLRTSHHDDAAAPNLVADRIHLSNAAGELRLADETAPREERRHSMPTQATPTATLVIPPRRVRLGGSFAQALAQRTSQTAQSNVSGSTAGRNRRIAQIWSGVMLGRHR